LLSIAAGRGGIEIISYILSLDETQLSQPNKVSHTNALFSICDNSRLEQWGSTAVHVAVSTNPDVEVVRVLMDHPSYQENTDHASA